MKYLLYTAILAFTLWLGSELIEIIQDGYTSTVFYMTSAYHILAGFGIWGIHQLQSKKKNFLSSTGVLLISSTYFALAYFPIQVMNSGLSVSEFIGINPIYKIPGLINLVGFIVFGTAVIRTKYFPAWTGIFIILGTLIYAIAIALKFPIVVNINNMILSITIIYMCIFGLRKIRKNQ